MLFVRQSIQTFPDILSYILSGFVAGSLLISFVHIFRHYFYMDSSLFVLKIPSSSFVRLIILFVRAIQIRFACNLRSFFFQFANKRLSSFFVHYRALQLGRCRNATLNWHFASGFLEVLAAADIIFSFTLISPNSAVTTLRPPLAYLIIKCHFNNRCNTSGLP